MNFDKLRNRYSFNFLAVCGWICFILFLIFTCPEMYITYIVGKSDHAFDVGITFILIVLFTIICFFISLVIFCIEKFFNIKNVGNKYLENKYIMFVQTLGIIFVILPPIVLFLIVLLSFSL